MSELSANMFVFAGNNGSGKSTIRNLIVDQLGVSVNIDPDTLARGIDPDNPEQHKISAGKKAIRLARECIRNHRDFSVETTLAGGNTIRLMKSAKENGFNVTMFFIGLGDYLLNIERVAVRVQNGGHYIHTDDIVRRHKTSLQNLLSNLYLIDYLLVIDNRDSIGKIVLEADCNNINYQLDPLPLWVEKIKQKLK
ncbi:zeta toxin family protein [Chengkuizengella marina]|uniref:UDP-N-acetylglucosamine kinase n=1 Tax=Chengkuizengella marina TaxID=2507566 RepID=A0A6N9Q937_9BACL|nr:zeta toxin family protein [Chengkuizengella marina]NBI31201.1 hypothetical protein [Chengkuizengella marina]